MICKPLAEALEDGRARYNAEFAQARHRMPGLEASALAEHLRDVVSPAIEALAQVSPPDKVREAVDVLYEFSLELLGKGLFSRYPALLEGWTTLLPGLAPALGAEPRRFAGSVTNALHKLASTPGARPGQWIDALLFLGPICADADQLLEAGKVLAWRAGLAHYRLGALAVARSLPPALALAALGADASPEDAGALIDRLEADPWLAPADALRPSRTRELRIVARAGAFRGFGGLFIRPPRVLSVGPDLYVTDGEDCFSLHADRFGAVFQRVAKTPDPQPGSSNYTLVDGMVHSAEGHRQVFSELEGFTSLAGTEHALAVTLPQSHAVYLVAIS